MWQTLDLLYSGHGTNVQDVIICGVARNLEFEMWNTRSHSDTGTMMCVAAEQLQSQGPMAGSRSGALAQVENHICGI